MRWLLTVRGMFWMNELTKSLLREYFEYREGNLFRIKTSTTRTDTLGKKFGGVTGNGYIQGWFLGKLYYLHHLVYIYHKGPLMKLIVDHIDGDKLNNTIENLRLVTTQQNTFNSSPQKGKSSKYKGVAWDKKRKKWRARIVISGKEIYLGRYDSEQDAKAAYDNAAKEHQGDYRKIQP